jgi:hypothetical protein
LKADNFEDIAYGIVLFQNGNDNLFEWGDDNIAYLTVTYFHSLGNGDGRSSWGGRALSPAGQA